MAKNFATSYVLPYKGVVRSQPVKFCDGANAAVVDIPWRAYGIDLGATIRTYVNPGVRIGWTNSPALVLDGVQGVYIDNTDCDSPVYLRAEDTGHMIVCPDGSAGFFPILTNGSDFVAYIESIAAPYEKNQSTRILFCDKPFPPTSDPQFNEFIPANQVSGDSAFITNVQGDQIYSDTTTYSGTTSSSNTRTWTLIPASAGNTLVITNIHLGANQFRTASERSCDVELTHNGKQVAAQRFLSRPYTLNGQAGGFVNSQVHPLSLQGFGVRLDARYPLTATMQLSSSGDTAGVNWTFSADISVVYAMIRNPTL